MPVTTGSIISPETESLEVSIAFLRSAAEEVIQSGIFSRLGSHRASMILEVLTHVAALEAERDAALAAEADAQKLSGKAQRKLVTAEAENARLSAMVEAAEKLCGIYFAIAKRFIPAHKIRRIRDEMICERVAAEKRS